MKKIFFCFLFLFFSSCDYIKEKNKEPEFSEAFNKLTNILQKSKDDSLKEIDKVRQLEYKVLTLPFDPANPKTSSLEINALLNDYGKDRWDCYAIEKSIGESEMNFILFLKRPIDTPLRYLPGNIIK